MLCFDWLRTYWRETEKHLLCCAAPPWPTAGNHPSLVQVLLHKVAQLFGGHDLTTNIMGRKANTADSVERLLLSEDHVVSDHQLNCCPEDSHTWDWVRAFSAGCAVGMGQQRAAVATGSSPAAFSTGWNLGEVMAVALGLAEEA
ncbi:Rna-Binding Protein Luc7-Like 2-Like [Manis pentadactyla]|nr:Rna-Binding Protein Luc7-Like 2-Like [Manis pentadactyla]